MVDYPDIHGPGLVLILDLATISGHFMGLARAPCIPHLAQLQPDARRSHRKVWGRELSTGNAVRFGMAVMLV